MRWGARPSDCGLGRERTSENVACAGSFWWRRRFQAHNLETGVHVENISSDAAAQVAAEEDGGVGDFGDVCVAAQRRVFLHEVENLGEILDAAGGDSFYGSGG